MAGWQGKNSAKWLVSGPPLLFLFVFFVLPAAMMIVASWRIPGEHGGLAPLFPRQPGQEGGLTAENYVLFFSDWIYAAILVKSLSVAAITTLICLSMAYPVALWIARGPERHRNFLVLLVVLPFASNFLVRIYAWIIILGPLHLLHSRTAVIIGMVYVHLPFMILPLYTSLERIDPLLLDAACDLGANAWNRFWRVIVPLSMPGALSGSALVFIPVLGMFAIPELLGGKDDWMIGNMIKEAFLGVRDWPFGSMISLVLSFVVLLVAAVSVRLSRRGGSVA